MVAVIRSTGQSLLDYVPFGATTEGFAGTYATQENFRLMRAALDEVSVELGRYIRLTNYASGLCMPEIAAMAAMERLDMMLNDCMYGIIFRDINMQRTFVDQHFSRMVNALAGIVINTGEDNYLTTANAVESAHTVLASQFLNERLARLAGLEEEQMGLGHAFEIDPDTDDQIALELAHAQLIRECFPNAPLKYMPPTKHMTGNIFQGFLYDGMFNLVGALTGQDIILLGMMTEGVHTPFLSDRDLALENARYVFRGAGTLAGELRFEPGGDVERRAAQVLEECRLMLRKVAEIGMFAAIEAGMFADTVRTRDGGRGLDGVVPARRRLRESIERHACDQGGCDLLNAVKPYGDASDDGLVQFSFTLPMIADERARQSALELARRMGFERPQVVHMKAMGPDFTFFVLYGATTHSVDPDEVSVPEKGFPELSYQEVNRMIREHLKRRLVVVGACTGTDAHTVGLDAILSMKGFAGDKGLEYFQEMQVVNMGSQVEPDAIVERVRSEHADAVLVSQVVTQRDAHIHHLKAVRDALVEAGERDRVVLVGGGPRFSRSRPTSSVTTGSSDAARNRPRSRRYLAWTIASKGAA